MKTNRTRAAEKMLMPNAGVRRSRQLPIAAILLLGLVARIGQAQSSTSKSGDEIGRVKIPLWDESSSASAGKNSETASLTAFLPRQEKANGTAVVIAPGGAYRGLAVDLEGNEVAAWFAARGITAFVLRYRLGTENPYPIPLRDAQRAVRLVRSLSAQYSLSSNRIGIMGFSAGGHLAAMEATSADDGLSDSPDPINSVSDKPDFLVLGYAWLNAMHSDRSQFISYCSVMPAFSPDDCKAWEALYTPLTHVNSKVPPTFIYGTTDDTVVPVQASVDFYSALLKAGVPVEMHIFRHGAHGSGLGKGDQALGNWPILLEAWLRLQGLLPMDSSPQSVKLQH